MAKYMSQFDEDALKPNPTPYVPYKHRKPYVPYGRGRGGRY
jgi:energy-converting hydrogenase Eha subunit F